MSRQTTLGRLYASHKGHVEVLDWKLPDGRTYVLEVRTRRGSTFSAPLVHARLRDGQMNPLSSYEGRLDELNDWLREWQLTIG